MTACGFSQDLLFSWMDGEAGARAQAVNEHLESCATCRTTVQGLKREGQALRSMIDSAIGDVEPLFAIARIRERIEQTSVQSPWAKLQRAWHDLLAYHRKAVVGVALAAGLGALSAPAVVLWARHEVRGGGYDAALASVVIESMEWDGDAKAVVYRGDRGATTLIWMEPDANPDRDHPRGVGTP